MESVENLVKERTISFEGQRLVEGMRRAVQKVIEQARQKNEELVISRDGKIVHVKARDL